MNQTLGKTTHVTGVSKGPVYWITLNQTAKRNAMSLEAWQAIPDLIREAEEDAAVRVIVFRGSGDEAFSAGADISEFPELRMEVEDGLKYNDAHNGAETAVLECSKPTLAIVNGWCVGGGLQLAMACDIRLGTNQSRFGITPARLGIVISHQTTTRMEAELGPAWTKLLLFTGRIVDATEAQRLNIIQYMGSETYIEEQGETLIEDIIRGEPLAQHATKHFSLRNVRSRTEDSYERQLVTESLLNDNYRDAVSSFINKSEVNFSDAPAHEGSR